MSSSRQPLPGYGFRLYEIGETAKLRHGAIKP